MKHRLLITILVLGLIVSPLMASCAQPAPAPSPAPAPAPAPAPPPEPLRIGSVGPRTGWGAVYVQDYMDLKHVYANDINARGGIHGRPIEIIEYDDETEPELSYLYTKKLIEEDNVLAITGPEFTEHVMAGIQAARFQGVPLFYVTPTEWQPELSQPGSNIFATQPTPYGYLNAVIIYLKEKQGVKNIAILATVGEAGDEDVGWFTESAEANGIEIIADERIDPDAIDAIPQLTKIKAINPDAIILGGGGNVIGPIMKGIKLLGLDKLPIGGTTGFTSAETLDLIVGYEPEMLLMPLMGPHQPAFGLLPPGDPKIEIADSMIEMFMSEYGETMGTRRDLLVGWLWCGMDYMDLVVEGLRQAGPLPDDIHAAREAVNNAFENKIIGFQQLIGKRTMTPTDHIGITLEADVKMITIRGGEIVLVED